MFSKLKKALAAVTVLAMALLGAGCSNSSGSDEISIGIPSGWDEGIVMSNIVAVALEEQGYDVKLTDADVGVVFTGVSKGDFDLMLDGWMPVTHEAYLDKYGDKLEDLGVWFDSAKLALTVNSDSPAQSIDDLAAMADEYNNEIIGIDAGAGITQLTESAVIPQYGLDGMEYKLSSTSAMLAELQGAQQSGRNIVVTLWSPHWAYSEFDIRDLEDPKGVYGAAEEIHNYARLGFSEDHPEIAKMLSGVSLTSEELADAGNYIVNKNGDRDGKQVAKEWLDENPEIRDRLQLEK